MASKINKGEILAKFFDDGEYTALFADGAVSAACGYAAGQQAYAVYQNGEAVTVKDVEKNIKVLEMAAQTGCPVVTFYNSVGAKLAEGLDVLTASAKLNAQIAKVSGVVPQVAVVLGVCGGTSALSAANADVCIMAEGAELFFTAPFTSAAKGDKVADAGSAAAAAKAGVASIVAADAAEAAEKAAHIVGLLPANNLTGPAIFEFEQPTAALAAGAEPAKAAAATWGSCRSTSAHSRPIPVSMWWLRYANRISPSCPMRQTRLTSLNSASDPKQPCKSPTAHRLFGIQAMDCGAFFIAFAKQNFLSL